NPPGRTTAAVEWLADELRAGSAPGLVDDQWHTPTTVADAAASLRWLTTASVTGTVHVASPTPTTKYALGRRIARRLGFDPDRLSRLSADTLDWTAERPRRATLSSVRPDDRGVEPTRLIPADG
ncbi:MAG: sugar nucleotide-binding protein, partial [Halobaculum sp.]